MLSRILGVLWIILGLWWLLRPQTLKKRLQRKFSRKLKRVVFGFILVFGFLMIGSALKAPGILSKVIVIIGMILAIKAIMLITGKTSDKVFAWWADKPLYFFRAWALFVLTTGAVLVFL